MTGLPSVDVRSVGAGGGSIACVDAGGCFTWARERRRRPGPGLLRARWHRADPDRRLPGARIPRPRLLPRRPDSSSTADAREAGHRRSSRDAARTRRSRCRGGDLADGDRAHGQAIEEITIHQGIDPRQAVLVGGGGAAGFNTVAIARRLGRAARSSSRHGAGAERRRGAHLRSGPKDSRSRAQTDRRASTTRPVTTCSPSSRTGRRLHRLAPGDAAIASSSRVLRWRPATRHQVWELECPARAGRSHAVAAATSAQLRRGLPRGPRGRLSRSPTRVADRVRELACASLVSSARAARVTASRRPGDGASRQPRHLPRGPRAGRRPESGASDASRSISTQVGPAIVETATTTVLIDDGAPASLTPADGDRCTSCPSHGCRGHERGERTWTASAWRF